MRRDLATWRNVACLATFFILIATMTLHVRRARFERNDDLVRAAERGDVSRVDRLLQWGADRDARRHDDATPLLVAARGGHLPVVKHLVEAGADVHATHPAMGSPLLTATMHRRVDIVQYLLDHGANPNERSRFGYPVLGLAVSRGSVEVVRVFLHAGADPNATSDDGWTVLMFADDPNDPAAKVLAELGARTTAGPRTHGRPTAAKSS